MNAVIPSPASRLTARFGAKRLADWSGRHISRIYAWSWSIANGGTGGVVPIRVRQRIIDGALKDMGEELDWSEFEPQPGETYDVEMAA